MSQKFAGRVEIESSASTPKVRIALSGDSGSAQFTGDRPTSPRTGIAHDHIAVGKKPRPAPKRAGAAASAARARIDLDGDGDAAAPPTGTAFDASKSPAVFIAVGDEGLPGGVFVNDAKGKTVFRLNGVTASLTVGAEGNAGDVFVVDAKGEPRIRLNGSTGDVELAGADLAEEFDVEPGAGSVEPGTVMTIGATGLLPCTDAYDRCAAGIVSGAGSYRAGIVLDKARPTGKRRVPLALSGKAFCRVDANLAPIAPGDLLTTSTTPGHAMRADPTQALCCVIGKALQALPSGRGLIPVLVTLR